MQADSNDNDDEDAPSIYDEDITTTIIQELGLIGEVTLVRFVGETMWVTFRDGQSALIAVQKKSICIRGIEFHFNLKTENWLAQVEKEIALCTTNTVQLCTSSPGKNRTNAIFFKNFVIKSNIRIIRILVGDYNQLGIPKKPPMRPKSPPARPPLPSSSNLTPKHTPKAGVISIAPKYPENINPNESKPCVPHRPAPTVNASQSYQQQSPDLSGPFSKSSSTSSTPSPSYEQRQSVPSVQSFSIQDQDTGAIYEEINDDVVSL